MSDNIIPFPAPRSCESAGDTPPEAMPTESVASLAHLLPPEAQTVIALISEGLTPDADETARTVAREVWARFAAMLASLPAAIAAAEPMATAMPPVMPPPPPPPPVMAFPPVMPLPTAPPSPIRMAARALSQLPPDQLLDLAISRLRSKLPAGANVATPKGIQFQLVPVVPSGR